MFKCFARPKKMSIVQVRATLYFMLYSLLIVTLMIINAMPSYARILPGERFCAFYLRGRLELRYLKHHTFYRSRSSRAIINVLLPAYLPPRPDLALRARNRRVIEEDFHVPYRLSVLCAPLNAHAILSTFLR